MEQLEPLVIGWKEYVAVPAWGIKRILAKADTGARTSAVDVRDIEELGDERVRFALVVRRQTEKRSEQRQMVEADVVRRSRVKSSFGAVHDRLVVATRVVIGSREKEIELSLVSRQRMVCRMLLGRAALAPDFLVDSSRRHVLRPPSKGPECR